MDINFEEFTFSSNKDLISIDKICELLGESYWANHRSRETIEKSIKNSTCIGIYFKGNMVGFARIITDNATMYYLCDVIVDEKFRGKGLGKKLIEIITNMKELEGLSGILATRDAQKLYEKYGFIGAPENLYMRRKETLE
jgi:N-acetylglutamate synthase-like GNAT family acetyltransferase